LEHFDPPASGRSGSENTMRVLIVDDEASNRSYLAQMVRRWGYDTSEAADGEEAFEAISDSPPSVVLSDLVMPRLDGFELLMRLKQSGCFPPVILMTAFGSVERAVRTIHEFGGYWFLEKPIDLPALRLLLERAGGHAMLAAENLELKRQLSFQGVLGDMVGQTPAMREVFAIVRQVAPTSAAVLITGESGTGKELVARALHSNSRRASSPFVAINCAAMPESLMESEIFGHEKGAFTGAVERRIGAMEAAQKGTLFLDELGEMPMAMQAKLLRVLEDLRFRRLGGRTEMQADIRIIAATNRDPMKAIQDGKLREDLYYRLNVFNINLPPLRERKEDIPIIVSALIANLNRKHDTSVEDAGPAFLQMLNMRSWDGNVRELRNVIERAVIIAGSGLLQPSHLPMHLHQASRPATAPSPDPGGLGITVGMTVDEAERLLIEGTLKQTQNNKTRAASILGISAKTLHAKLRLYRLDSGEATEEGDQM